MTALNTNQTGLTVGSISAIFHTLWVVVVGIGLGQWLTNLLHSLHFLEDMHTIDSFSLGTAVLGIIGAFIIGYVAGWLFAVLWNWFEGRIRW